MIVSLANGQTTDPALMEAELEELQAVVRALRSENDRLRRDLVEQQERRRVQEREVRELRDELAGLTGTSHGREQGGQEKTQPVVAERPERFPVEYVNVDYHYVVLQAGTDQGLDLGMEGEVERDGKMVARIRVIHVLPRQSVADIQPDSLRGTGGYPQKGDVVVWNGSR